MSITVGWRPVDGYHSLTNGQSATKQIIEEIAGHHWPIHLSQEYVDKLNGAKAALVARNDPVAKDMDELIDAILMYGEIVVEYSA